MSLKRPKRPKHQTEEQKEVARAEVAKKASIVAQKAFTKLVPIPPPKKKVIATPAPIAEKAVVDAGKAAK